MNPTARSAKPVGLVCWKLSRVPSGDDLGGELGPGHPRPLLRRSRPSAGRRGIRAAPGSPSAGNRRATGRTAGSSGGSTTRIGSPHFSPIARFSSARATNSASVAAWSCWRVSARSTSARRTVSRSTTPSRSQLAGVVRAPPRRDGWRPGPSAGRPGSSGRRSRRRRPRWPPSGRRDRSGAGRRRAASFACS